MSKSSKGASAPPAAVEDRLFRMPQEARPALESLRQTIKEAAPGAVEIISYQLPAFRLNGKPLVAYGATANHCALYLMSASTVESHAEELKHYDTSKGTIRFPSDQPLPAALVRKLVQARIRENETRTTQKGGKT